MGDLRLLREQRDGRELLFAATAAGEVVWGSDPATGHEWWYVSTGVAELRPRVAALLVAATPHVPAIHDLALRAPGESLLAQVERCHRVATSTAVGGEPGTLDPDIVPWCVGYVGEEQVGASLTVLPRPWHVLHSVPVGTQGADIDHVLVGPPGVVTINTKHHNGGKVDVRGEAVFVGGTYQHYVRNARTEAEHAHKASDASGVAARLYPAVCVVGARVTVKEPADGVTVLPLPELAGWLLALPRLLTDEQVLALYEHLRQSTSWGQAELPPRPEPWVADVARGLAIEHRVARSAPARRGGGAVQSSRTSTATRRTRTVRRNPGRRSSSWRLELLRGVILMGALIALAVWGPAALSSLIHTPAVPKPAVTQLAPLTGAPCATKGKQVTRADGRSFVCQIAGQTNKLAWQPAK